MVIVDTSAWVEYLRNGDRAVADAVERLVDAGEAATTEPIHLELLAGARDERHSRQLEAMLARTTVVPTKNTHYTTAALLFRACRRQGETVRRLFDCVIAAVAVDADLPVLHNDRDFDALARHTPLRVTARQ